VEDIKRSFDNNHRPSTLHTGADATETSVKVISGTKPYILHIATHGFYFTDTQAKRQSLLSTIGEDERRSAADLEDKALTRSGLLMAGVNVLKDKDLPMGADDGILTAQEISRLDLRGLDLVVLSACKTGKGDITQGEGVFGLQRGFKKAGAQTLVMSLWEVADDATQILMTAFYDNLLKGESKREAFMHAQQYLRQCDNGIFNRPEYWAAFILLD
jgi:CHAT domain-containing protein